MVMFGQSTVSNNRNLSVPLDQILKIKGLPFKAANEDVIKFLQDHNVSDDGVYLKRNTDGKVNGEAYVVFTSKVDAERAKSEKNRKQFGQKFGDRFVKLFSVSYNDQSDFIGTVQQTNQPQATNKNDCVIKLKYLPAGTNQIDIITYFEGYNLKPNGVQLVVKPDNTPTQEAFVDFETQAEALRALENKNSRQPFNQTKFGDRYIQLIQVSRKEMQTSLSLRFGGEGILKMKGIPFGASSDDIRYFLKGFKIKPLGINFIMRDDGTSSGMAFIEFESPQEALKCLDAKHRKQFGPKFGTRFCQLEPVGRQQMEKAKLAKEQISILQDDPSQVQTALRLASLSSSLGDNNSLNSSNAQLSQKQLHALLLNIANGQNVATRPQYGPSPLTGVDYFNNLPMQSTDQLQAGYKQQIEKPFSLPNQAINQSYQSIEQQLAAQLQAMQLQGLPQNMQQNDCKTSLNNPLGLINQCKIGQPATQQALLGATNQIQHRPSISFGSTGLGLDESNISSFSSGSPHSQQGMIPGINLEPLSQDTYLQTIIPQQTVGLSSCEVGSQSMIQKPQSLTGVQLGMVVDQQRANENEQNQATRWQSSQII